MNTKMNHELGKRGALFGAVCGWMTSVGLILAGGAVLTILVLEGVISWNGVSYCAAAVLLIASFGGANVEVSQMEEKSLLACVLSGVILSATLLLVTMTIFGARYEGVPATLMLVACGSICAMLIHCTPKQRRTHKRHKRRL